MTYKDRALKVKLKADADRYSDSQRVRLHRALSWLQHAESEGVDDDARFIFL